MAEERIISDPDVMLGKPAVRGTRITVEYILEQLAGGWTLDELIDAHPALDEEAIRAALRFAAESMKRERALPTRAA